MNKTKPAPGLAARQTAIHWLKLCLRQHIPLDEVVQDGATAELDARDRNLARLIVLTSLRRKGEIEAILAKFLERGLPRKSGLLREILHTSVTQLVFLGMPAHAVVDCAIRMARKDRNARHLKNLANGVLRNVARAGGGLADPASAGQVNTPQWLWETWVEAYGAGTAKAIAEMHLAPAPLDLTVKSAPEDWAAKLSGTALPSGTVRLGKAGAIPDLPGFTEGEWWVQDMAAAIPAKLFGDLRGRKVLDMCAAPGGKTAQLALAGGEVTALDISGARLARVQENLDRLRLDAELIEVDANNWDTRRTFDAVLLDAPCSSTGTIRRHPDVQWLKQPEHVTALVSVQNQLLRKARSLLKPGGRLVYCVCSLQRPEGEQQIEQFLQDHPDMLREAVEPCKVGLPEEAANPQGDLRLRPDLLAGQGGMDGFFISVLNRSA